MNDLFKTTIGLEPVEEHSVMTKQLHDTINAMNSETDKEIYTSVDELFDKLIGE